MPGKNAKQHSNRRRSRGSAQASSAPKSMPRARKQRMLSCWSASMLDPWNDGPCSIPDPITTDSCKESSTSLYSHNLTSMATPSTAYTGALVFSPLPHTHATFYNFNNTTGDLVTVTSSDVLNLRAIMPNYDNPAEMDCVRATAIGVSANLWSQHRFLSGEVVVGFLPYALTSSTSDLVGISGVSPAGVINRLRGRETHAITPEWKGFSTLWRPRGVPEYMEVTGTTGGAINAAYLKENYDQDNLVILFRGVQTDTSGEIGPLVKVQTRCHWEVIPGDVSAMAVAPTASKYDVRALENALNSIQGAPTSSSREPKGSASASEQTWTDYATVAAKAIPDFIRGAVPVAEFVMNTFGAEVPHNMLLRH